jgi:hypothetical protein
MGQNCYAPKMVVDNAGIIHAVWCMWVTSSYRKIMYSKSQDLGSTWSDPQTIANDSLHWLGGPSICCDQLNNLYVCYEGDDNNPAITLIYFLKFDGTQWSNPAVLSTNMESSNRSLIVCDNSGKVYCFWHYWYNGDSKLIYRYLENNQWSDIFIPYTQQDEFFWITKIVVDSSNNLHCVGTHHYANQTRYNDRVVYLFYSSQNNIWDPLVNISDTTFYSWQGNSISLDNSQNPHFCWGQFIQIYPELQSASFYSDVPSSSNQVDTIESDSNAYAYDHQLVIDQGDVPIVCFKSWSYNSDISNLISHRLVNGEWEKDLIDSITGAFRQPFMIELCPEYVGVIYSKIGFFYSDTISDLFFSKFSRFTAVNPNVKPKPNINVYPNPFKDRLNLEFNIDKTTNVNISILDVLAKTNTTVLNENFLPGKYSIPWLCKSLNRKEVKNQIYIIRFQIGLRVYSYELLQLN